MTISTRQCLRHSWPYLSTRDCKATQKLQMLTPSTTPSILRILHRFAKYQMPATQYGKISARCCSASQGLSLTPAISCTSNGNVSKWCKSAEKAWSGSVLYAEQILPNDRWGGFTGHVRTKIECLPACTPRSVRQPWLQAPCGCMPKVSHASNRATPALYDQDLCELCPVSRLPALVYDKSFMLQPKAIIHYS